jgi:hypothetical protein
MPDKSLQADAANLAEILSDKTEFKSPVHAQAADALKRFAGACDALATKAKATTGSSLDLEELISDAYDTAKKERNARASELKAAWDGLIGFLAAARRLAEGDVPAGFAPAGEAVQKVLDKIEFKDQKQIDELRKKAKAYYPKESALVKEAEAWSVRAAQVAKAVKAAADALDPEDSVAKVHIAFLKRYAARVVEAAKILR